MIELIYPRWLFPNNLGDSIMVGILPPILRDFYNSPVKVYTYGEDYCKLMGCAVDSKDIEWVNCNTQVPMLDYRSYAMSNYNRATNLKVVYPEWHPNLWDEYGHFYGFSISILAVNYLLQLGFDSRSIRELYFKGTYSLIPSIRTQTKHPGPWRPLRIGIVPDTKLANRPVPHPGCDGIGYRFNGPNGEKSWAELVSELRSYYGHKIKIIEFSENSRLNLGDEVIGHTDLFKLAQIVENLDFCILSDGGMHHLCNAMGVHTYLLNAQKINKAEYFQTSMDWVGERSCKCDILGLKGWTDLDKVCNLECEKVDPKKVAEGVIECLKYRKIIV